MKPYLQYFTGFAVAALIASLALNWALITGNLQTPTVDWLTELAVMHQTMKK